VKEGTYYARHRDERLAYAKAYRESRRGPDWRPFRAKFATKAEADAAYRAQHRSYFREKVRAWRQAHRDEESRRADARRRAFVRAHTEAEWAALKEQHDFRCAYCGCRPERLTRDHVIPISRHPDRTTVDRIDNIVPACWSCNSAKGAKEGGPKANPISSPAVGSGTDEPDQGELPFPWKGAHL
jgi:5-methylcytosine-specific restriction endonuclease McrA